jgi:hypothetical protein
MNRYATFEEILYQRIVGPIGAAIAMNSAGHNYPRGNLIGNNSA